MCYFLLVLPEFIPFNNECDNKRHPISSSHHARHEREHDQLIRSPNFQNPERNTESRFSDHRQQINENGNRRHSSRESHRSAHSSKGNYSKQRSSPVRSNGSRNRSRSPQNSRNVQKVNYESKQGVMQGRSPIRRSPVPGSRERDYSPSPNTLRNELLATFEQHKRSPNFGRRPRNPERSRSPQNPRSKPMENYDNLRGLPEPALEISPNYGHNSSNRSPPRHPRIESTRQDYRRSLDRTSCDRSRNGSSVFDRMSSPPPLRRYGDQIVSRRSVESNSNGPQSYFVRTVQVRTYEDALHQSNDRALDNDRRSLQRDQSPNNVRRSPDIGLTFDSRPLMVVDPYVELRNYKNRLAAAETHCIGIETTVKSYEREIHKLRQIVNNLIEDFEILQSNIR